jgi:hypothetical protein
MMPIKKALNRRSFLRGAGTMISLPLLDAMVPALTPIRLTAASAAMRLGFIYTPNGVVQKAWIPAKTGSGYELPDAMRPLEPFRQQVLLLSNLAQHAGRPIGDGGGDHSRASATWLTGVAPKRTEGSDVEAGISADQIAAYELGKKTPLRSLELGLERSPLPDSGYNSIYANTISWRTPTIPNAAETNPRQAFEVMFGSKGSADEDAAPRLYSRRSILDAVRPDVSRLRSRLGARDRSRLDQHLENIRNLELRIEAVDRQSVSDSFEDRAKLMGDLMVMAFQTDMTRVVSFMLAREGSELQYPSLGVSEGHHAVSHHRNDSGKIAKTLKINQLHAALFSYVIDRMQSTPDGDGTLLDNSLLLFGSSLGDGNDHTHHDLPLVLAGGKNCNIKGGKHIRYAQDTPMNNLLVTMLRKAGVPVGSIGDSTGELDLVQVEAVA